MIDYLVLLIVLPVVTWRITHLFIEEDGPFDIFLKLRIFTNKTKFLKELFTCFLCFSIWIGFILAFLTLPMEFVLLGGFYFSGVAILLEKHL